MKSLTFGLGLIGFRNSHKRRALIPRRLIAGIEKVVRNKLKVIRFAFTVFLVKLQKVIINQIHFNTF